MTSIHIIRKSAAISPYVVFRDDVYLNDVLMLLLDKLLKDMTVTEIIIRRFER